MKLSLSVKAALCAFVMLTGIFLNLIIPPFQYPDEPLHFGLVLSFAGWEDSASIEKDIIKWMDHFNWWKHVGMGKPHKLPERFREIKILNFKDNRTHFGRLTGFHYAAGKFLRAIACRDTLVSYYICRLLSLIAVIGSWAIIFLIFMRLSRHLDAGLIAAPFLILFLPQLHLLALGVNPDAVIVLLGTVFFSVVLKVFPSGKIYPSFILLIPPAFLGLLIDESSFILFALVLLFPFFLTLSDFREKKWEKAVIPAAALMFLVIWASWYLPMVYFDILRQVRHSVIRNLPGIWGLFSLSAFHFRFFNLLGDSFLFQFGWMAFRIHEVFYLVWKALLALSFIGTIFFFRKTAEARGGGKELPAKNRSIIRICLFFFAALALQLIGLWMAQGTQAVLPQGRYFMPLIVPIGLIICLGLGTFFYRILGLHGRTILFIFILMEFFLLNYCIWNEIIPVYYLKILSPHPGM